MLTNLCKVILILLSKNPAEVVRGKAKMGGFAIYLIFFIIYFTVAYCAAFLGRSKEVWLGGIIGGGLGGILGWIFGATILIILIVAAIGGGVGYLLDTILSRNYQKRKARGFSTNWWDSAGGFSSGSGGGGFGKGWSEG